MEVAGCVARREAVRMRAVGFLETGVAQTAVLMKFRVLQTTVITVIVGGNITVRGKR